MHRFNLKAPARIACVVAAVLLSASSLLSSPSAPDLTVPADRKPAPSFTLKDQKGKPLTLSDYRGKVVLLNFWATWCHGCQTEIPWFAEFQKKYADQGLAVVGLSMDKDGWKSVTPYLREKKLNYAIGIGNDALAKQYGLDNMPLTILIDKDGKIAETHSGVVDRAGIENDIQALLK
jgi:cytochrome c biogenesis protein CcmG/thiol:disulfide interchange protein DsbE